MKESIKIGIVAGEHSGDILGENFIKALKKIKNVKIFGVGGPKMEKQGLSSLFDFNNLNIMGLVDPILNYSKIMTYKNELCNLFIDNNNSTCSNNAIYIINNNTFLLNGNNQFTPHLSNLQISRNWNNICLKIIINGLKNTTWPEWVVGLRLLGGYVGGPPRVTTTMVFKPADPKKSTYFK